ncbi:SDR family oxidoreductase [Nocardioides sp. NPDC006303]|uniref:SDR family oxidoreductase n=1 Tax=Nocardioides sp. NPDC006303 TaxID=3156747 RepID=UPI0033B4F665
MTTRTAGRVAGKVAVVTGAARGMGAAHARLLMTKSVAVTCVPDNIRINSVHPGVVFTEMLDQELEGLGLDSLDDFLRATPLRRGAAPDEVSRCVLFLASGDGSFVTGAEAGRTLTKYPNDR